MIEKDEIEQIIDHKESQGQFTLQIKWKESYTWEPFSQIYKDVPELVTEYCESKNLKIKEILEKEAEAKRGRFGQGRGGDRGRGEFRGGSAYRGDSRGFRGGRGSFRGARCYPYWGPSG